MRQYRALYYHPSRPLRDFKAAGFAAQTLGFNGPAACFC
jgi:hypothetical protein